jgi:DNA-binding NarL/FixJ family response regulator
MPPTQTDEGARDAEMIRERYPNVGVLMLSQIVEPHTAMRLFGERPEGFGYLLKDRVLEIDDFIEAVKRVARGGTAMDPQTKLRLAQAPDDHRRVLAVLAYLRSGSQ